VRRVDASEHQGFSEGVAPAELVINHFPFTRWTFWSAATALTTLFVFEST
jgi:hypothetical protein